MNNDGYKDKPAIRQEVSEYYGKELKNNKDLKTNACRCSCKVSPEVSEALSLISDEILDRFYGCGSPIPLLLEGMTVLDLGCGTGRDVYIVSKLVGESGHVIGIDMTPEQLEVAERYKDTQMKKFGYSGCNVEFKKGFIEDLKAAGIEDGSVDVVISNCVINLSPEKERVFAEIYRVLKKGGELLFSDVFADRRIPDEVYNDPVIRGECLGGAMYIEDFRRTMQKVGFMDYRDVSVSEVTIDNDLIRDKIGDTRFTSHTIRAFKIDGLEDICEDYGQMASYMGDIPNHPDYFDLDDHHRFYRGEWMEVCGNTAAMVSETRYRKAFVVKGDRSVHRGRFDCSKDATCSSGGGCCC